nr:PREDICTED: CKLF-like MARVEL transmembrane domain-containing protein 7 [Equus przewalskii]
MPSGEQAPPHNQDSHPSDNTSTLLSSFMVFGRQNASDVGEHGPWSQRDLSTKPTTAAYKLGSLGLVIEPFSVVVPWVPALGRPLSDVSVFVSQVTLLIAFICVRSSPWTSYSAYSYFEVVTICNLIMILAFYLVHLFRLYRVLTCISWPLSELLHYLIGTLLLLIASIVAASKSYNQSGLVAGAIFGFIASFLCLASIWLSYKISCVTQSTDVTA